MNNQVIYPYRTIEWVVERKRKRLQNPEFTSLAAYKITSHISLDAFSPISQVRQPLDPEHKGDNLMLVGFDTSEQALELSLKLSIQGVSSLFKGEDAVAQEKDIIQLAIIWNSKPSMQRGVGQVLELHSNSNSQIVLKHQFPVGQLRQAVNISVGMFLKKQGSPSNSPGYASQPGAYLGCLYGPVTLWLEGRGAMFPLIIDDDMKSDDPPWTIRMEYALPLEDSFSKDHFAIVINPNHRDSAFLLPPPEDPKSIQPALKEVVASALGILMNQLRSNKGDWNEILAGKSDPGSLGAAVEYFHHVKQANSPEQHKLVAQIRSKLSR